jgi:hypothetical protein
MMRLSTPEVPTSPASTKNAREPTEDELISEKA